MLSTMSQNIMISILFWLRLSHIPFLNEVRCKTTRRCQCEVIVVFCFCIGGRFQLRKFCNMGDRRMNVYTAFTDWHWRGNAVLGNYLTQWHFVHLQSRVDLQHLQGLHSASSVCRRKDGVVLLGKPIGMDVQVVKKPPRFKELEFSFSSLRSVLGHLNARFVFSLDPLLLMFIILLQWNTVSRCEDVQGLNMIGMRWVLIEWTQHKRGRETWAKYTARNIPLEIPRRK
jgi:hypothetical protein